MGWQDDAVVSTAAKPWERDEIVKGLSQSARNTIAQAGDVAVDTPTIYNTPDQVYRDGQFQQVGPEYRRQEEMQNRLRATPDTSVPAIRAMGNQIVAGAADLGGLMGRTVLAPFSDPAAADEAHRLATTLRGQANIVSEQAMMPTVTKYGSQAVGTLAKVVPLAAGTGGVGVIAEAGLSRSSQALQEAKDAGLSEDKSLNYAARAGTIEAGITTLFQGLGKYIPGLKGLEGMTPTAPFSKEIGKKFVRDLGISTVAELTEEETIALLDSVNQAVSGVDPKATNAENLWQTMKETAAVTLATMGLAKAPSVAEAAMRPIATAGTLRTPEGATQFAAANPDAAASIIANPSRRNIAKQTGTGQRSWADQKRRESLVERLKAGMPPAAPASPEAANVAPTPTETTPEPTTAAEVPAAQPADAAPATETVGPPPPKPGFVRFYHGGVEYEGGKRWLTPDPAYAQGYADKGGGFVHYVDVPENDPRLMKSFDDSGTNVKAPYMSFEADEDIARRLRPLAPQKPTAEPTPQQQGPPPVGTKVRVISNSGKDWGETTISGYDDEGRVLFDKAIKTGTKRAMLEGVTLQPLEGAPTPAPQAPPAQQAQPEPPKSSKDSSEEEIAANLQKKIEERQAKKKLGQKKEEPKVAEPEEFSVSSLTKAFNLKQEEAEAVNALAMSIGLDLQRTRVASGGVPSGEALHQAAWHGSPHTHNKFSTDKIGTGEGAQAYGWGLYFAGSRKVAEWYRDKLSNRKPDPLTAAERSELLEIGIKIGKAKNGAAPPPTKAEIARWEELRAKQDAGKNTELPKGRLYKVDLRPAEDEYLLWDKPIGEQSDKVKTSLASMERDVPEIRALVSYSRSRPVRWRQLEDAMYTTDGAEYRDFGENSDLIDEFVGYQDETNYSPARAILEYSSEDRMRIISAFNEVAPELGDRILAGATGRDLYRFLARDSSWDGASQMLRLAGVRGNKYLDGSSRGKGEGEGSYNYVIFDDADVSIEAMYQANKGFVEFAANGRAIIRGFESADVSTGIHEIAHVARRQLLNSRVPEKYRAGVSSEDIRIAEEWAGAERGDWSRDAEEKFARGMERYLRDGMAPSEDLKGLFEKVAGWLRRIYASLTGSPINIEISPAMREVFDRLMTRSKRLGQKKAEPIPAPVEPAKEPWQMRQVEFVDGKIKSPGLHREHVRQAIERGNPVPVEVLADYPDLAKQQNVDPEFDGARTELKKYGVEVEVVDSTNDTHKAAADMAKSLGLKPVFVRFGGKKGFNGYAKGKTILLDADLPTDQQTWYIAGHEIAHSSNVDKELDVDDATVQKWQDDYLAGIPKDNFSYLAYLESNPQNLRREAVAHMIGRFMTDSGFRAELEAGDPTLFQKIVKAVAKFFSGRKMTKEARATLNALKAKKVEAKAKTETEAEPTVAAEPVKAEEKSTAASKKAQSAADKSTKKVEGMAAGPVGSIAVKERPDVVPDVAKVPNEEVERRMSSAHGLRRRPLLERLTTLLGIAKNKATRANEFLPNTAEWAYENEWFRVLKEISQSEQDETLRTVAAIVDPIGPKQRILFERKLMIDNLIAAYRRGEPLRFGFSSLDEMLAYQTKLNDAIAQVPEIQKALESRKEVVAELVQDLVDNDLLEPEALDNAESYFHHQVLSKYDAAQRSGAGAGRPVVKKYGFQRKRVQGDELSEEYDPNTDWIQAESEWMYEARVALAKKRALEDLEEKRDIRDTLKAQAKKQNMVNLVGGEENYNRIEELRGLIAESQESEDSQDSGERMMRKQWIDELTKLDPTYPFRIKIAMHMGRLLRAWKKGEFTAPGFEDVLNAQSGVEDADATSADDLDGQWFRFLNWAASERGDEKEGIAAKGIFKAIGDRNQFIKDELAGQFVTWQELIPETHSVYQPEPGNYFYQALTLPEQIAEKIQSGLVSELTITPEDVRQVLVMAGPRKQLVLKNELVEQLNALKKYDVPGLVSRAAENVMSMWKRWQLLKPVTNLGYFVRNLLSDVEAAFGADFGIAKHIPQAFNELRDYYQTQAKLGLGNAVKLSMSDGLRAARDYGVLQAGMAANEIPDIAELSVFERFYSPDQKTLGQKLAVPYQRVKELHKFREALARYAAFLRYRELLQSGKLVNYGGAKPDVVKSIKKEMGVDAAAAHLSRNLLGDYGNLTVLGNWLRSKAMPFWSWNEINLKRMPRMIANARLEGKLTGKSSKQKQAVLTGVALMRLGWLAASSAAWNYLLFPDEEDELGEYDRAKVHIVTGRNPDGTIALLRNISAVGDFLEWFGINSIVSLLDNVEAGQMTIDEAIAEAAKDPINKLAQGLGPQFKAPLEIGAGKTIFPDVLNPRTIDREEALAQNLGIRDEYLTVKGSVLGTGQRGKGNYVQRMTGQSVVDPRENALNEVYDLRDRFLKKGGQDVPSGDANFKNMRQAAAQNDAERFAEARALYLKSGKGYSNFESSLKRLDPVAGALNNADEAKFVNEFLTPVQRQRLDVARQHARNLEVWMRRMWQDVGSKTDSPEQQASTRYQVNKSLMNAADTLAEAPPLKIAQRNEWRTRGDDAVKRITAEGTSLGELRTRYWQYLQTELKDPTARQARFNRFTQRLLQALRRS